MILNEIQQVLDRCSQPYFICYQPEWEEKQGREFKTYVVFQSVHCVLGHDDLDKFIKEIKRSKQYIKIELRQQAQGVLKDINKITNRKYEYYNHNRIIINISGVSAMDIGYPTSDPYWDKTISKMLHSLQKLCYYLASIKTIGTVKYEPPFNKVQCIEGLNKTLNLITKFIDGSDLPTFKKLLIKQISPTDKQINWVGEPEELVYFINGLTSFFRFGKNKQWSFAVNNFTLKGEFITAYNLKNNKGKKLMEQHKRVLDVIINNLSAQ